MKREITIMYVDDKTLYEAFYILRVLWWLTCFLRRISLPSVIVKIVVFKWNVI